MNLVSTTLLSGVATFIRILTGLVVNKIFALYIGPAGMALTGQFSNFVSMILGFANVGISNGVVKYVAEYHSDEQRRRAIVVTGFYITIVASVLLALPMFFFRRQLALSFLKDESFSSIFVVFAATLMVFSLNSLLLSILNGFKEVRKYTTVNIATSIASLVITSVLATAWGVYGALLSLVLSQTLVFFVTLVLVARSNWFRVENFISGANRESMGKLFRFSAMSLVSGSLVPLSQIAVREYITKHLSLTAAGYWQGIWRISDMYLMIVTTSLAVYYLPRLSEINETEELRNEIFSGYRIILPIVAVAALGIFVCRDLIIRLLFSADFAGMRDLFAFQLIGDFLKIASWLLSYLMVARAMARMFIVTEIAFAVGFVTLSMLLISRFGLIGVTYAFAANYFLYLLLMTFSFRAVLWPKRATS